MFSFLAYLGFPLQFSHFACLEILLTREMVLTKSQTLFNAHFEKFNVKFPPARIYYTLLPLYCT